MKNTDIMRLVQNKIDQHKLTKSMITKSVRSLGNSRYGNSYSDEESDELIYTSTFGVGLGTLTSFSSEYIACGYVTVNGLLSSKNGTVEADILNMFKESRFIEILTKNERYSSDLQIVVDDIYSQLLKVYNVVEIKQAFIAGSGLIQETTILKLK